MVAVIEAARSNEKGSGNISPCAGHESDTKRIWLRLSLSLSSLLSPVSLLMVRDIKFLTFYSIICPLPRQFIVVPWLAIFLDEDSSSKYTVPTSIYTFPRGSHAPFSSLFSFPPWPELRVLGQEISQVPFRSEGPTGPTT